MSIAINTDQLTRNPGACPAQWEGQTVEGGSFYIHYRFGRLTIQVWDTDMPSTDDFFDEKSYALVADIDESGWDGTMTVAELLARDDVQAAITWITTDPEAASSALKGDPDAHRTD